ncbi:MAG: PDZ domain-containing protein [Bacteriovoracaceae bacterium]|nr:PDZ domain-containing protein [Bacteriovoracaceae bacterium]
MMSKIRNLIQKLKKPKAVEDQEQDEYTTEEVLANSDSTDDGTISDASELDEPTAEHHLAINSQSEEELPPSTPVEMHASEEDATDVTGSIDEIDLDNGKLGLKDRLQMKTTEIKDKLNRIDFRKFKTPKIENGDLSPKAKKDLVAAAKTKMSNIDTHKIKLFHQQIFDPKYRNRIHKTFQYAMIFGSVFVVGKNAALFLKSTDQGVSGSPELKLDQSKLLTRKDLNEIKTSGLFKTEAGKPVDNLKKPVIAQDIKCESARRKSSLPIKLLNTVVLQDSIKSIASVQVRSGRELTEVREGDKIAGMAKIDKIDRQKIIVKNLQDGNCEVIENQKDKGRPSPIALMSPAKSKAFTKNKTKIEGVENDGNKYTIEKGFLQDKMKNISDVLTQARGIQLTNPDGTLSFKIVDIEPGGLFSYLGIQNNDVITHINGKKISNLNEVMSLFGKISNVDKMNLTVTRGGDEVPLQYNIR